MSCHQSQQKWQLCEENLGWVLDEKVATVGAVACPTILLTLVPPLRPNIGRVDINRARHGLCIQRNAAPRYLFKEGLAARRQ